MSHEKLYVKFKVNILFQFSLKKNDSNIVKLSHLVVMETQFCTNCFMHIMC